MSITYYLRKKISFPFIKPHLKCMTKNVNTVYLKSNTLLFYLVIYSITSIITLAYVSHNYRQCYLHTKKQL